MQHSVWPGITSFMPGGVEKTQNALVRGRQLCSHLSMFERRLADLLRFWCCQLRKLRRSRRIFAFLMLSSSKVEETSELPARQASRQTDKQTDNYNYNYTTSHCTSLDYTALYHTRHYSTQPTCSTEPTYSTLHHSTLQYSTLHYTTLHHSYNYHYYNYTNYTTLQLTTTPPHYNYNHNIPNYNCTTAHYIQQLWMRWPLQPLQPLQKTQLQPPFGPSVDSLCHPWFTTTNLSYYRFPIFETSATALWGTTGNYNHRGSNSCSSNFNKLSLPSSTSVK